ncbi:hypothetical protein H0A61_01624 [Koleobacter methoxysyntrophicus]|uniref:ThiS family protein n=1 Tax=Koleobacter methoxysyntrophicus TaxID=2751313 RepID=A0A8A0RLY7_9FIRM|nr:MoaD/ThiS family protein [Koleobacter methoxysyntrophicus]QSQ09263.1 hypothetical protein H0A61_01624 [Koleobacter methoxysyntrophicus]
MINITIKAEGIKESSGISFKVKANSSILDAMKQIIESKQSGYDFLSNVFFHEEKDYSVKVYMVLVNNKIVRYTNFDNYKLCDRDEITIILPFAGG